MDDDHRFFRETLQNPAYRVAQHSITCKDTKSLLYLSYREICAYSSAWSELSSFKGDVGSSNLSGRTNDKQASITQPGQSSGLLIREPKVQIFLGALVNTPHKHEIDAPGFCLENAGRYRGGVLKIKICVASIKMMLYPLTVENAECYRGDALK